MKIKWILIWLLFLISGCFSKYDYWDISKFNLKRGALQDNEEVRVIYFSRGPDYNRDFTYYYQLVVVSVKSGDTFNVLCTGYPQLEQGTIYNFSGPDSDMAKYSEMTPEAMKGITHVDSLKKISLKKITRVARDPEFDYIADNNFPTEIGVLGIVTNTKVE